MRKKKLIQRLDEPEINMNQFAFIFYIEKYSCWAAVVKIPKTESSINMYIKSVSSYRKIFSSRGYQYHLCWLVNAFFQTVKMIRMVYKL